MQQGSRGRIGRGGSSLPGGLPTGRVGGTPLAFAVASLVPVPRFLSETVGAYWLLLPLEQHPRQE
jgi:hypothetical protein